MPTEWGTARFLGIEFACANYGQVAAALEGLSASDRFAFVVTPNVDHVVMLHEHKDEDIRRRFNAAYKAAALRLCDSRVLQLLAKFRGVKLDVVTGSDLTAYLLTNGHFLGKKVAIIGGDPEMLLELDRKYPGIELAQHIPPMGVLQNQKAAEDIADFLAASPSHYVLFAIGSPQSEIIAHQCLMAGCARGVALCVGASLEFVLGRKTRAPLWMQRARLEWAFRLMSEPGRLWRRYLLDGPRVLRILSIKPDKL
jgi:N-acetylglucosaminyldiphosphoundecaprenol N-acetyl-beta-D-mannosaminyltransferase